eukprot:47522_1
MGNKNVSSSKQVKQQSKVVIQAEKSSNVEQDMASHKSYQYNATGPLKHILPEFCVEDDGWYGVDEMSYFEWKLLHFDEFNTLQQLNIERFVQCFWYKTCRNSEITEKMDIAINDFKFKIDSGKYERIEKVRWNVIKHVNHPTAETILDIASMMTDKKDIDLRKYDKELLCGYMRIIDARFMTDVVVSICLMFLNDEKTARIESIGRSWHWNIKVDARHWTQSDPNYKQTQDDINGALWDIVKDHPAKKCLFTRGCFQSEAGDDENVFDTMDIWWLLHKQITQNNKTSNALLIRFHRNWHEKAKSM